MKYSVKLILWNVPNADGFYPIYLRAIVNRKPKYKATNHVIAKKMWDQKNEQVKEGHRNAALINADISEIKTEWLKKIITERLKGNTLTAYQLKESFISDQHNIFNYVDGLIKRLKGKKSDSTLENYKKHLHKLEEFNGSRVLAFETIDSSFLGLYEAWLRENINFRKDDPQKNYIHAIWKTLKTWFNAARKQKLISHYPFDEYENPVYVSPDKDFLSVAELRLFGDFADETKNPILKETAIYFLFGCYSGLRISDWYKFDQEKHVKNGKLRLRPAKTKHKWVEMIVSKPLARNLERMKEVKLQLKEATINEKLKIIAKIIGINKHITSHSARHTFAVTICLGNKVSSETAAELMGITLETYVKNYSQVTQSKIDNETKEAWKNLK